MTLYIVLFLMGFMLAIGLLAYSSMQVAELGKKIVNLEGILKERYSKSVKEFAMDKREEPKEEEEETEANPETELEAAEPAEAKNA